jgi:adenylate kinase family enzyme
MKIAFLTFDQYKNIENTAGTRLRATQLMPYLNAEPWIAGKKYDVVICQKAYFKVQSKIKILDICDPDYLRIPLIETIRHFDAVTCSTLALADDIKEYTDKPVKVIKDRYEIKDIPEHKKLNKECKTAVWFGYSDNFEQLEVAIPAIKKHKLKLIVIADRPYNTSVVDTEFIQWTPDYYKDIQKADIAILPKMNKGKFKYKSENKKVLAELLGLPVAETQEEMEKIINIYPISMGENIEMLKEKYDCKKSAKELKKLINELWKKK